MSDTVHCHMYVTHSHPNRAIHKKKVQKDLPNGFKKVKESKELKPPLYCFNLLNCVYVYLCLYLCLFVCVCAGFTHLWFCDWSVFCCVKHLDHCVKKVWSRQTVRTMSWPWACNVQWPVHHFRYCCTVGVFTDTPTHTAITLTWDCCVLLLSSLEALDHTSTHTHTQTSSHSRTQWFMASNIVNKSQGQDEGLGQQLAGHTHTNKHTKQAHTDTGIYTYTVVH